jgi:hypothetical protein
MTRHAWRSTAAPSAPPSRPTTLPGPVAGSLFPSESRVPSGRFRQWTSSRLRVSTPFARRGRKTVGQPEADGSAAWQEQESCCERTEPNRPDRRRIHAGWDRRTARAHPVRRAARPGRRTPRSGDRGTRLLPVRRARRRRARGRVHHERSLRGRDLRLRHRQRSPAAPWPPKAESSGSPPKTSRWPTRRATQPCNSG